ncbi:MAG: SRPBCC family protein [Woeseiaceae bacterium]|nr:SRPBCC family protein [Woeseiaceae bacterium]
MNDYAEMIDKDAVRFVRILPGPIERVWSFLVEPEKRARWLCGGETEPTVGGRVEMKFHNETLSGDADIEPPEKYKKYAGPISFQGKVIAYEPPRLLTHSWDFEGNSSEVTYELSEQDGQVKLVLTHRRLDSREEMASVCGGWHTHLDILSDILEEKSPRPFWKHQTAVEAEYENRLPR